MYYIELRKSLLYCRLSSYCVMFSQVVQCARRIYGYVKNVNTIFKWCNVLNDVNALFTWDVRYVSEMK
jgi:hypothetical protein